MRHSIKCILAVTITFTLTVAMLKIAALSLNCRYNSYHSGDVPYHFYKDNMEYDVLFIGTSHVHCGINPMQLWHDRGISSYNLAISDARIPSSFHILKNAIRYHKPKIAILDTFYTSINEKVSTRLDLLHFSLDIVPLSYKKYESLEDLFPDFKQRMSYVLPYSLFHNRWKESSLEKAWDAIFHTNTSVSKGFTYATTTNVSFPAIYSKTDLPLPNNTIGMDYIRKFIMLCRENGILPILITIPYPAGEYSQMEENSVTILSRELEVTYYNLNKTKLIDWDTDLNDPNSHVNISGAYKITDWIGKILNEEYHLEDHRGNINFVSWDDDYKAFRESLFSIIRGITDKKQILMCCNNSDFTVRLSIKDGVELDSVEQKLVTQLGDAIHVEHIASSDEKTSSTNITPDIRLEIYDSESKKLICEKQW